MHQPSLIFVDEPMAGLDPILRERMWLALRELKENGCTIVLTTQITQEAERCDALALIKDGRLIALGTPDELRQRAFGGSVVRLIVDGGRLTPEAMSVLWGASGVREVIRESDDAIRVITDDGVGSVDQVVETARRRGVQVQAVEKTTTSFDEVFERLVKRE
jgi:ABC-2 type transport system ATP-binding protein